MKPHLEIRSFWGPALAAFFCGLTLLTLPRQTLNGGLDPSWAAILAYAHQRGIQFGSDIAFSYGPLGFLITPYFIGQALWLRFLTDIIVCFGVSFAMCQWLWRINPGWRVLGLLLFVLILSNARYGAQDLLIDLGFVAMGLFCLFGRNGRLGGWAAGLCVLGAFGALGKFSIFLTAGVTVAVVSGEMILRGKRTDGLALAAAFVLLFLAGWEMCGQRFGHLSAFIVTGWSLSNGFGGAMALESPLAVAAGASISMVLVMALLVIRGCGAYSAQDGCIIWRRVLLIAWLSVLLFVNWKHGLVRPDVEHSFFFFGFAACSAFLMLGIPGGSPSAQAWSRGLCVVSSLACILTLRILLYPDSLHVETPLVRAVENSSSLIGPGAYWREMEGKLQAARRSGALPKLSRKIGPGPVDVFGNSQAYALFNDLNYAPRPALQSYAAYSSSLMQMDECFYYSKRAPEFELFQLAALDHRFPAMEDALVLRDLLINYDFCQSEGPFLLLQAKRASRPVLTLLREGTVGWGQQIDVSSFKDQNLWVQIDIKPTLAGRILQLLYKAPQTWLMVSSGEGTNRGYELFRAPAPMLKAGFIASPLLSDNSDVLTVYSGLETRRPSAFFLEVDPGARRFWAPIIHFRLYRIENKIGGYGPALSSNATVVPDF